MFSPLFSVYGIAMNASSQPSSLPRVFLSLALCVLMSLLLACGKRSIPADFPTDTRGAAIAAAARSQIGKLYRKGGISPKSGFDCSGLVYWACGQNGISVPRVSREQAKVGQKVGRAALRPGDIVVFKTSWTGYHTGIYIGQGRFVHSPKPRTRVRTDSLDHVYWGEHFVSGRRVTR